MLLQDNNSGTGELPTAAIEARSSMYRLLASFFARELTEERITSFQNGRGSQLLDALEEVEAYTAFIRRLKKHFAKIDNLPDAVLDLAESYAWSFHGVGGSNASPLYASVYLCENASTHQETERELRNIIRRQGLSAEKIDNEAYDHLSVILEFIAWLDEKEENVQQRNFTQKTRTEVIGKYLLPWLPTFVSQCKRGDLPGFYSGLASAVLTFTEADFAQSKSSNHFKKGSLV